MKVQDSESERILMGKNNLNSQENMVNKKWKKIPVTNDALKH